MWELQTAQKPSLFDLRKVCHGYGPSLSVDEQLHRLEKSKSIFALQHVHSTCWIICRDQSRRRDNNVLRWRLKMFYIYQCCLERIRYRIDIPLRIVCFIHSHYAFRSDQDEIRRHVYNQESAERQAALRGTESTWGLKIVTLSFIVTWWFHFLVVCPNAYR